MLPTRMNPFFAGSLLIFFSVQISSCATEAIQGSIDIANEKEGGSSALNNGYDVGFNVALGWTLGLSGGTAGQLSGGMRGPELVDSTWNPYESPFEQPSPAGGGFVINPMVEFVQKGDKTFGARNRENFLEVQADFVYKYPFSKGGAVFGGLGPFIAYGVGGKLGGGKISSFDSQDGIKRLDAGLNLKAGYVFANTLQFDLGYDLGLVNRSRQPDYTTKSRNLSFSVGYSVDKIIGVFKKH